MSGCAAYQVNHSGGMILNKPSNIAWRLTLVLDTASQVHKSQVLKAAILAQPHPDVLRLDITMSATMLVKPVISLQSAFAMQNMSLVSKQSAAVCRHCKALTNTSLMLHHTCGCMQCTICQQLHGQEIVRSPRVGVRWGWECKSGRQHQHSMSRVEQRCSRV